jgi:DNA-directed RNA polymerase specialized sigma24 family protein
MVRLFKIFNRGVRYYLARYLGAGDLEERLHETFLLVVTAVQEGELRHPERLRALVRTVVQSQVATYSNQATRCWQSENDPALKRGLRCRKENPEELAALPKLASLIQTVLLKMPDRAREALTRFYVLKHEPERICLDLGLTEAQFQSTISALKAVFETANRDKSRSPPVLSAAR